MSFVVPHPFANGAKGWGTLFRADRCKLQMGLWSELPILRHVVLEAGRRIATRLERMVASRGITLAVLILILLGDIQTHADDV